MHSKNLTRGVKHKALELGFDLVAVAAVGASPDYQRYVRWLEADRAGDMGYLLRHASLKADPRNLLPDARSMVVVALNYAQAVDPALRADPSRGQIAAYALGDDYHKIMRKALIQLDAWIRAQTGRTSHGRVFVDSAPILERSWASRAGLGFIGKNTCLIHPRLGSYFFLGGLLIPEPLQPDGAPHIQASSASSMIWWRFDDGARATCGRCTRCLDVCPTNALVSAHELDARLCISYLTIELRGEIPPELRPKIGNWVFGCDLCQDVCPWNRQAPPATHPRLQPHPDRLAPPLLDLLALSPEDFARRFRGSAVKRAKWEGFMRNVCVAAGNWGEPAALEALTYHLHHSPALVATHAAWALARLKGDAGRAALEKWMSERG
ncbi:MAG: tRNA epoxyqueuosine(34) reductase QueG [Chloroflexi bacterium]|nr:tRNA epoxyqueuosine(34) reductase QueG [Chloroflexota bacterium]